MNDKEKISLCLADAQSVFRMGLRKLLSAYHELDIKGEAGNMKELKMVIGKHHPTILILDYNPKYFDGAELSRVLNEAPDCRVIIISSQIHKLGIFKSLDLNILAYLTKECSTDEIVKAIQAVNTGKRFFCNNMLDSLLKNKLIQQDQVENNSLKVNNLTKREIEIVKLVALGKRNKEIAVDLNVSHHTVHTHRKNILKKVGVRSALELTNYAKEIGII